MNPSLAHRTLGAHTPEFLSRARDIGVTSEHHWPYGPSADPDARIRMVEWAERHGLKLHHRRWCTHWLRTGRCSPKTLCGISSWQDHPTGWTFNGEPACIIGQPYSLSGNAFADLAKLTKDGFCVNVGTDGWYGHGTLIVEVWREEAWLALLAWKRREEQS